MGAKASQITSLTIVYWTVYSGEDQREKQTPCHGLCAGNSPVIREFPAQMTSNAKNNSFDDVIMNEIPFKSMHPKQNKLVEWYHEQYATNLYLSHWVPRRGDMSSLGNTTTSFMLKHGLIYYTKLPFTGFSSLCRRSTLYLIQSSGISNCKTGSSATWQDNSPPISKRFIGNSIQMA